MDLKPVHLFAVYLIGLVLISIGVGFYDWRLALIVLGFGIAAPVLTLPGGNK